MAPAAAPRFWRSANSSSSSVAPSSTRCGTSRRGTAGGLGAGPPSASPPSFATAAPTLSRFLLVVLGSLPMLDVLEGWALTPLELREASFCTVSTLPTASRMLMSFASRLANSPSCGSALARSCHISDSTTSLISSTRTRLRISSLSMASTRAWVLSCERNPSWSIYYRTLVLALRGAHRCLRSHGGGGGGG